MTKSAQDAAPLHVVCYNQFMGKKNSKPVVALVGRPNVGKSTMFNRLVGRRKALVDSTPGLTRDRNYAAASVADIPFMVVDTGGFERDTDGTLLSQMRAQTMFAVEEADAVVFIADAKTGLTHSDKDIVRILQRSHKDIIYVVNKVDSEKQEPQALDFCELGAPFIALSARTGYGFDDLRDTLAATLRGIDLNEAEEAVPEQGPVKVAVVGRPNVGKSTLINLLLGEERLVANPEPGTTRDSIDTLVKRGNREYLFIDTAGIRRKSRIEDRAEKFSAIKAFQSIDRADIVLVMMDASEPATDQDVRIAGHAHEASRGVILVLNKWDLVPKEAQDHDEFIDKVRFKIKFLDHSPIVTISAVKGTRAVKLFDLVDHLNECRLKRVTTGELNRFIQNMVKTHPPGMFHNHKPVKFLFVTQVQVGPPTFVFSCNYPEALHFSYIRFIENRIREAFGFDGAPIKLILRKRSERGAAPQRSNRGPGPARRERSARDKGRSS
jgi:GTPase